MPTRGTRSVRARTAASSAASRAGCSAGGIGRGGRARASSGVYVPATERPRAGRRAREEPGTNEPAVLRSSGGSTDTGMPVASPRTSRRRDGETAAQERKRPKRPVERDTVDVISSSPVPDGPFGQDLRYEPGRGGSTRLSTNFAPRGPERVHEFRRRVDGRWTSATGRTTGVVGGRATRRSRTSRPGAGRSSPRTGARSSGRPGPPRRPRSPPAARRRSPRARTSPRRSVPRGREQARVELAVGRDPGPGAVPAERRGDRGDDPDLAAAVDVAPAVGDLARVVRRQRLEGHLRPRWPRSPPRPGRPRPSASRSSARRPCTR